MISLQPIALSRRFGKSPLLSLVVTISLLQPQIALGQEGDDAAGGGIAKAPAKEDPSAALAAAAAALEEVTARFETLRNEFAGAKPERQTAIRNEGAELQMKGMAALSQLADAFPAAYEKAPDDALVKKWLPDILGVFFQLNRYRDVAKFGKKLIAAEQFEGNKAEQLTGMALFALHQFPESERVLATAQKAGRLDPSGARFLKDAQAYQEFWKTEEGLRAKEKTINDLPRVLIKTSRGDIEIELFENEAPETVGNFVSLVEKKFYDGIAFHRVIPGFMAQGGDPNTLDEDPRNDGQGGPGYTILCECQSEKARMHFAGSLSMAHAGKDTGGSQFFLTHLPTSHLNGKHTVFGRVVNGLDVVWALQIGDKIIEAKVLRKRPHEYVPKKG